MPRLPTAVRDYARASRSFTPREVPGLAIWRSNLGPHWQDAERTTPGAVGSPVGAADDISGNEKHLVQATSASRPILSGTGPSIDFDGSDDAMQTNHDLDPYGGFAFMAVLSVTDA